MPSIASQIQLSDFPLATRKPVGDAGDFTGEMGIEAMINARRLQSTKPGATVTTLAAAIALAESTMQSGELVTTEEYESGTGKGGNTYKLLDAGTSGSRPSADDGHIIHVGTNGLYLKGQFYGGVFIEQFGDTTNPSVLSAAVAYAVATGKKLKGEEIETTSPIILQSGLSLEIKKITNTAPTSTTNGVFTAGDFDMPESSSRSYYALNDLIKGSSEIELSSAGDAANFNVGDLVFIRAGSFYYSDGNKVCSVMLLNEVAEINSGQLTLTYPIPRGETSAEICVCTDVAIKDVKVSVESVEATNANPAKLFKQGGGVLRSVFNFQNINADSIFFTNAFTGCTLTAESCRFTRHVYEMATGSYANAFSIASAEMISGGVSGKRPFRISESASFNTIYVGDLNLNKASVDTSALHYIEGYDNNVTIGNVTADNFTGDLFRFISAGYAFTGNPHYIENNEIKVGTVTIGDAIQDIVHFEEANDGYLRNNTLIVTGRTEGVPTGYAVRMDGVANAVRGGKFLRGGVLVETSSVDEVLDVELGERLLAGETESRLKLYDLRLPSTRNIKALRERKGYQSLIDSGGTETTILSKTISANTLVTGNVISIKSYGELLGELSNPGTTGAHSVELRINGTKVSSIDFAAGEYGKWQADFDLFISSMTAIQYAARLFDTIYSTDSNGLSTANLTSNALTVDIVAVHASGNNDRFRLRFAEFDIKGN